MCFVMLVDCVGVIGWVKGFVIGVYCFEVLDVVVCCVIVIKFVMVIWGMVDCMLYVVYFLLLFSELFLDVLVYWLFGVGYYSFEDVFGVIVDCIVMFFV